jgi:hypothetical protein
MGEISPNPSFSKRGKFGRRIFSLFSGGADTRYYLSLTVMRSITRIDPTSPFEKVGSRGFEFSNEENLPWPLFLKVGKLSTSLISY